MSLALITGATAGIGAEFARQLAAQGTNLILVARDTARLEAKAAELHAAFGVDSEVLTADLMTPDGLAAVEKRVARDDVTLLVNNAGFGLRPPFDENPIEDEQGHLDLLVAVPMRLTHAALQQMLPKKSGTIINIASVAGFTPRGSYGAAKAWLLSFSRWANIHYRSRGITVTAVAPGFVHTEFHDRMKVDKDNVPAFMWLNADQLVRIALRDVARGRAISVPTFRYKFLVWLTKWVPASIVAKGALRGR
ncbi:SDR family NAD(P)-dependent oxidoreductase [Glaciihabitans arcticus]|uniref:SDR family NAD(P)-dependent oxidoreductase n=1 Tax=Glaciihabitans arcticus TaxID=2668039 RepID=A0A4Q9GNW0_9MICO|nr:SDR family NAD(P)-dependent oxidoreductase [Glaciihabitans arcticus]TBN56416.1 SDR family NAD(P)-dependent oxidoreductase [Glaciihabitans arcticus]